MNIRILLGLVLLFSITTYTLAQTRSPKRATPNLTTLSQTTVNNNSQVLPIRRVILYSNGVAYIERRGVVPARAEINLSFKQSQVDDVLKSMVVLDLGQGRIGAVSYNSSAPVTAKMSEIPFSVDSNTNEGGGLAGVLSQLQGAKVAVTSNKGVVSGSILTVEKREVKTEKTTVNTYFLVVASETGELSSFDLSEVRSVKLLDEGTRRDVNEFANATASARRRDAKTITVTSEGAAQREMIVSYTIAAPIWKTTYRVVLDQEGKPFFQGWAIVDNVSEEDWSNVQLSLVSGTPISFIQPIQQPFYRYRPVVPIPNDLKLSPQVYENGEYDNSNSVSGVVTDASGVVVAGASIKIRNSSTGQETSISTNENGYFRSSSLSAGNYTVTIEYSGFQKTVISDVKVGAGIANNFNVILEVANVSSVVTVTSESIQRLPSDNRNFSQYMQLSPGVSSNTIIADGDVISKTITSGNSGVDTAATGEEIGDLFEYRIDRPITVPRDRSALIPIVQTQMDGERISIYNEVVRRDRPMSGILLKNKTNLTLESGSLTVLDRDAYAGEALMERLKPKEQRLISFALDLGTLVNVKSEDDDAPARFVKAVNGYLQMTYFSLEKKIYTLQNQTERQRTVFIEHPVRPDFQLSEETPKPEITTQRYYRFRVELKPFEKQTLTVVEKEENTTQYAISNLTREQISLFVSQKYISDEARRKLEHLLDLRLQIGQINSKISELDNEVRAISEDQDRLRENIKSLTNTAEAKQLIARYVAKANEQETRLEQIAKERASFIAERDKLQRELATEIAAFNL